MKQWGKKIKENLRKKNYIFFHSFSIIVLFLGPIFKYLAQIEGRGRGWGCGEGGHPLTSKRLTIIRYFRGGVVTRQIAGDHSVNLRLLFGKTKVVTVCRIYFNQSLSNKIGSFGSQQTKPTSHQPHLLPPPFFPPPAQTFGNWIVEGIVSKKSFGIGTLIG